MTDIDVLGHSRDRKTVYLGMTTAYLPCLSVPVKSQTKTAADDTIFLARLFSEKTTRYCHSPGVGGGVCENFDNF